MEDLFIMTYGIRDDIIYILYIFRKDPRSYRYIIMFIDSNNLVKERIGSHSCKKYRYIYIWKNHMETIFFPIILQRPLIITYGVPFFFCRTTNHRHTGTFL